MHRGWVRFWRKSRESTVFTDELWRLWSHCLFRANHKPVQVFVHGLADPVDVGVGQFITGRYALHKELYPKKKKTNPSPNTVWRRLEILKRLGNLNIQTGSRFSLVTVCHYETYNPSESQSEQADGQPVGSRWAADGQPVGSRRAAGGQPVGTEKKLKKAKHSENAENSKNAGDKQKVDSASADVDAVWAHYRHHRPKARVLGADTRKKILARLKEGSTAADLCLAIDGNYKSPHHCGQNDTRTEYHELELIVRSAEKVSAFIEHAENVAGPVLNARTRATMDAGAAYCERMKKGSP